MANSENLKPIRSESEARENGKKGGIKSGEVRRARKTLKEELLLLLESGNTQNKISLALIKKALKGDIKAFEEIFRRYYSPLCWYATGITGEMEAAEEIVEELFYVFWKDREHLQIFQSVKSYLYKAVRNAALQFCEHKEVKERYREYVLAGNATEQDSDPHRQLEYEELQGLIRHTLDKLPVRRLRIFEMHRMEGKKYAEIASSLSLSVKTVEAEMTKALRTLRNEIDNYILTK